MGHTTMFAETRKSDVREWGHSYYKCLDKIQTTNNWLVWLEASSTLDEETINFAGDKVDKHIFCSKEATEKAKQKDKNKQKMGNGSRDGGEVVVLRRKLT